MRWPWSRPRTPLVPLGGRILIEVPGGSPKAVRMAEIVFDLDQGTTVTFRDESRWMDRVMVPPVTESTSDLAIGNTISTARRGDHAMRGYEDPGLSWWDDEVNLDGGKPWTRL